MQSNASIEYRFIGVSPNYGRFLQLIVSVLFLLEWCVFEFIRIKWLSVLILNIMHDVEVADCELVTGRSNRKVHIHNNK